GNLLSKENAQEELMWVAKDVIGGLRIIPKHLKWFLKEASKNNYALEIRVPDVDKLSKGINRSFYSLGMSLLAAVFVLCGALFVGDVKVVKLSDIPILSWVFWSIAIYLMIRIALL